MLNTVYTTYSTSVSVNVACVMMVTGLWWYLCALYYIMYNKAESYLPQNLWSTFWPRKHTQLCTTTTLKVNT